MTRGSFYHHFENREDFVRAITRHWSATFTNEVNARVASQGLPPRETLLYLMRLIQSERLDRYDIAFRSWAAQDPLVAEEVRKVDLERYEFLLPIFAGLGFSGRDLTERVRMFLVYEVAQHWVSLPDDGDEDPEAIDRRLALITRPAAKS